MVEAPEGGAAMKVLSNTLRPVVERWDDPGDYPSGAGSGPLPSRDYVESIEGQVVVGINRAELDLAEEETVAEVFPAWLADNPGEINHDVPTLKVRKWRVKRLNGLRATLEVAEFECEPPERDWDV